MMSMVGLFRSLTAEIISAEITECFARIRLGLIGWSSISVVPPVADVASASAIVPLDFSLINEGEIVSGLMGLVGIAKKPGGYQAIVNAGGFALLSALCGNDVENNLRRFDVPNSVLNELVLRARVSRAAPIPSLSVLSASIKICIDLFASFSSHLEEADALKLAEFAQSDFGCRVIIESGCLDKMLILLAHAKAEIHSVLYEDDFGYIARFAYLAGVLSTIIAMTQFDFGCAAIIKAGGIDVLKGLPSGYPFDGKKAIALDNISRFHSKPASPATATMLLAVSGGQSSVAGAVAASDGPSCVGFR
jgi:hypothetical protein